jgi:hypothetical protein
MAKMPYEGWKEFYLVLLNLKIVTSVAIVENLTLIYMLWLFNKQKCVFYIWHDFKIDVFVAPYQEYVLRCL